MLKEQEILTELKQNTGTEHHFVIPFSNCVYTDGIRDLIKLCGCWWLISDTGILLSSKEELQKEFLLLNIKVTDDKKAIVTLKEDSDLKPIYEKEYSYTDFPLKEYEFYICNNIMLLKSEY